MSDVQEHFPDMKDDPISHLDKLIRHYTVISFIPDIDHYHRIQGIKSGTCIFRGCTEPIAWEDPQAKNFLCEGHFQIMKRWMDEARKALVTGQSSPFFEKMD